LNSIVLKMNESGTNKEIKIDDLSRNSFIGSYVKTKDIYFDCEDFFFYLCSEFPESGSSEQLIPDI